MALRNKERKKKKSIKTPQKEKKKTQNYEEEDEGGPVIKAADSSSYKSSVFLKEACSKTTTAPIKTDTKIFAVASVNSKNTMVKTPKTISKTRSSIVRLKTTKGSSRRKYKKSQAAIMSKKTMREIGCHRRLRKRIPSTIMA